MDVFTKLENILFYVFHSAVFFKSYHTVSFFISNDFPFTHTRFVTIHSVFSRNNVE